MYLVPKLFHILEQNNFQHLSFLNQANIFDKISMKNIKPLKQMDHFLNENIKHNKKQQKNIHKK